jgi:hypothetical protein
MEIIAILAWGVLLWLAFRWLLGMLSGGTHGSRRGGGREGRRHAASGDPLEDAEGEGV